MNAETWGWNRLDGETRWQHLKRIQQSHFEVEDHDVSFIDLNPAGLIELNNVISHNQSTYYFSITNGFSDETYTSDRDVFKLP